VRQDERERGEPSAVPGRIPKRTLWSRGRKGIAEGGETTLTTRVVVERDADLFEVVLTLCPRCGCAHFLHSGQQKPDQNRDDRDDHEQLDQGECFSVKRHHGRPPEGSDLCYTVNC